jgi:hypothetical protein
LTLNPKIQVELPESGVVVRRSGKYPAVYKVLRSYRNEKGQPASVRVNIGKFDQNTGKLIPNNRYWEYHDAPAENATDGSKIKAIVSFGTAFLADHVMDSLGVTETLNECLGDERSRLVRTAAVYMLAGGNSFKRVSDYLEDHAFPKESLTSKSASRLFASITSEERTAFFKKWVARRAVGKCLAYDVTSFSKRPEVMDDYDRVLGANGDRLPWTNIGCFFREDSGLPLFYVTYPRSIADNSRLPPMTIRNGELGVTDVEFVLDGKFFSTANLKHMSQNGLDFILKPPENREPAKAAIELARESLLSGIDKADDGTRGVAMKISHHGIPCTMMVYFSEDLKKLQRQTLSLKIEAQETKLSRLKKMSQRDLKEYRNHFSIVLTEKRAPLFRRDRAKTDKLARNHGFFCLLTNTDEDPAGVLRKFLRKKMIERCFDDLDNLADPKSPETDGAPALEGKLFCAFISLIVVAEIENKLRDATKKKGRSADLPVKRLEKMRAVISENGAIFMTPFSQPLRAILEPFGLGRAEAKKYIEKNI